MSESSQPSNENIETVASLVTPGRRIFEGAGADIVLIKDVSKYEYTDFSLVARLDGIGEVELPAHASSYAALTELTGVEITADTEPLEIIREVAKLNPQLMGINPQLPHAPLVFGYEIEIPDNPGTSEITVTARELENDEIVEKQYAGFAVRVSMNAIVYPSVNNLLLPDNVPSDGSSTIPGWYIFGDKLTDEGKFAASVIIGDPDIPMAYTELLGELEITEHLPEDIDGAAEILSHLSPEERALNAGTAAYGQGLYRFKMNGLMLGAPLFGGEAGFHDEGNGMFWMPISIVPVGR